MPAFFLKKRPMAAAVMLALFCLGWPAVPALARDGLPAGPVAALEITGNRAVSTGEIRLLMQLAEGEPFSAARLADDIRRLMDTGYFERVTDRVAAVPAGVAVTVAVVEKPLIDAITFTGNRSLPERVLLPESRLAEARFYDREAAADAVGYLTREYYRRGFIFAEVRLETAPVGDAALALVFHVDEGPRGRIGRVFFEGNEHFDDRKLLGEIRHRRRALYLFRRGAFSREQLRQDEESLVALYRRAGFVDATVTGREIAGETHLELGFFIDEGERFLVGRVTVVGEPFFPAGELLAEAGLAPGEPYAREHVSRAVRRLVERCRRDGHLFPAVETAETFNPETGRVDVAVSLDPGRPVVVEAIDIVGNQITRDRVIRRELTQLPGETYDGDRIRRSLDNLFALGYFDDLQIEPRDGSAADRIRLRLEVAEREKMSQLYFGGGYSTTDGLMGMVSLRQQNFDWRGRPRFIGGGQKLDLNLSLGGRSRDVRLGFTEPWLGDRPVSFGFDVYDWRREYRDEFEEKRAGGRLRFGWRPPGRWRYSLTPGIERVTVSDVRQAVYADEAGLDSIHSVTGGIVRDTRDSRVRPRAGTEQGLTLKYAGGLLGGSRDFTRSEYRLAWYRGLPGDWVFSSRTRLGYARPFGGSTRVPLAERFFAGGDRTVRGYANRSLGPRHPADPDVVIGGRFQVLETLELARPLPLAPNLQPELAFFTDAGQVWAGTNDFSFSDIKVGVGAGIRFNVPGMFPIQIDYAFALDPLPGESRGRLHFVFGGLDF